MATGAWGTEAVERAPISEIPLIKEVHIDGLVRARPMNPEWIRAHVSRLPVPLFPLPLLLCIHGVTRVLFSEMLVGASALFLNHVVLASALLVMSGFSHECECSWPSIKLGVMETLAAPLPACRSSAYTHFHLAWSGLATVSV